MMPPMELQFIVSVGVDPLDPEMQERIVASGRGAAARDIVRDELLSNLQSLSYVRSCRVRPLTSERTRAR